jgi:hypothetical protein
MHVVSTAVFCALVDILKEIAATMPVYDQSASMEWSFCQALTGIPYSTATWQLLNIDLHACMSACCWCPCDSF